MERSDGWSYTAEFGDESKSRHEAVGEVAIEARELRERRKGPIAPDGTYVGPSVLTATSRVYAFKPHICNYCKETFLTKAEHEKHTPCPHWIEQSPTETDRSTGGDA